MNRWLQAWTPLLYCALLFNFQSLSFSRSRNDTVSGTKELYDKSLLANAQKSDNSPVQNVYHGWSLFPFSTIITFPLAMKAGTSSIKCCRPSSLRFRNEWYRYLQIDLSKSYILFPIPLNPQFTAYDRFIIRNKYKLLFIFLFIRFEPPSHENAEKKKRYVMSFEKRVFKNLAFKVRNRRFACSTCCWFLILNFHHRNYKIKFFKVLAIYERNNIESLSPGVDLFWDGIK